MKKLIVVLCLVLTVSVYAQKDTAKIDTVKMFYDENVLTIDKLQAWLYEKVTAKQYAEFVQYYQAYLNEIFADWKKKKFGK